MNNDIAAARFATLDAFLSGSNLIDLDVARYEILSALADESYETRRALDTRVATLTALLDSDNLDTLRTAAFLLTMIAFSK